MKIDFNIVFSVWFAMLCVYVFAFFVGVIAAYLKGEYK